MVRILKKDATYEDLCAVPENFVAEILGGELYASPKPAFRHVRAASALGTLIGGPFQFGANGPGGWLILDEPELHFGADVVVPDLAGWREVLRLEGVRWSLTATYESEQRIRPEPFEAIDLELGALWGRPPALPEDG